MSPSAMLLPQGAAFFDPTDRAGQEMLNGDDRNHHAAARGNSVHAHSDVEPGDVLPDWLPMMMEAGHFNQEMPQNTTATPHANMVCPRFKPKSAATKLPAQKTKLKMRHFNIEMAAENHS